MYEWMHVWMDACMYVYGWMHVCMYGCIMYVCIGDQSLVGLKTATLVA